jgi:hypothetical protein
MLDRHEYELQKMRREEIRQQSEQFNLAQGARPPRSQPPFYASVLAGVGKVLVDVGSKLQDQYGSWVEEVQCAAEADCTDGSMAAEGASPVKC